MRRCAVAIACAATLLGSAGCRGGAERRAARFVPDGAQIIGGVDVHAVVGTSAYKSGKEMDSEALEALEEFKSCGVDPERLDAVVVGGNEKGRLVAVIVGPGIGEEKNLECLGDKVWDELGAGEFELKTVDGHRTFDIAAGMYVGLIIDARTLAISDAGWADEVRELADGKGTPAIEGSLREAYQEANKRKDMWVAAVMPENSPNELGVAGAAQTVTGWLDYGSGFQAEFKATFGEEGAAKDALDEAQQGLASLRAFALMLDLPSGLLADVEMETSGAQLRIEWAVQQETLDELAERAGR